MTKKKTYQTLVSKFIQVTKDKNFREPIPKVVNQTLFRKYVPNDDLATLGKSILQTNFKRFSKRTSRFFIPKNTNNETYLEIKKGLENNLFAKMLASPVRMDSFSRAKLPRDILIKWCTIKESDLGSSSDIIDKENEQKVIVGNTNSRDLIWIIPELTNKSYYGNGISGYTQKIKDIVSLMSIKGRHKTIIQDNQVKVFEIPSDIENTILTSWQSHVLTLSKQIIVTLKQEVPSPKTSLLHSQIATNLRLKWPQKNDYHVVPMVNITKNKKSKETIIEFNVPGLFGIEFAESLEHIFENYLSKDRNGAFYYIDIEPTISKSLQETLWSYSLYTRKQILR